MPPERPELIHSQDPSRITAAGVMSTAFYFHFCQLMAKFASLQDLAADEAFYQAEAEATRLAFNDKYFNAADGCYGNNTVTANILPLRFGMVDEVRRYSICSFGDISARRDGQVSAITFCFCLPAPAAARAAGLRQVRCAAR